MNASKIQVENSILFFAKKFNQEENFKAILQTYKGTPKIVEMIVYEMFLNRFNPYHSTDEEFENYNVIHEYATELKEKGWVSHKN